MAEEIVEKKLSVADASNLAKNSKRASKSRLFVQNSIPAELLKKYEKSIFRVLGVSSKIKEKRGGAGELYLTFSSRAQLEELVSKITASDI